MELTLWNPPCVPARQQCDYANQGQTGGVCPDKFFGEDNAEMLAASQEDDVTFVAWREPRVAGARVLRNRTLSPSSPCLVLAHPNAGLRVNPTNSLPAVDTQYDRDISLQLRSFVYAQGPLVSTSTIETPVCRPAFNDDALICWHSRRLPNELPLPHTHTPNPHSPLPLNVYPADRRLPPGETLFYKLQACPRHIAAHVQAADELRSHADDHASAAGCPQ